jgi:hypothetical protein
MTGDKDGSMREHLRHMREFKGQIQAGPAPEDAEQELLAAYTKVRISHAVTHMTGWVWSFKRHLTSTASQRTVMKTSPASIRADAAGLATAAIMLGMHPDSGLLMLLSRKDVL